MIGKISGFGGAASVALALATATAFAQGVPDVRRETTPAPAPAQPGSAPLPDDRDVGFDEAIRRPGDIELNLGLARTQIRNGELLPALVTLERILLQNPDLPQARLLYAIVLLRLDNAAEADRELQILLRYRMPAGLRYELEDYLDEARRRQRQTRFLAVARIGWHYDSNRTFANGGFVDSAAGPLQGAARRSDHALDGYLRLEVEHDLRLARRHRLFASGTFYHTQQLGLSHLTADGLEVAGGATLDFNPVELKLTGYYRYTMLHFRTLQHALGGELRFDLFTRQALAPFFALRLEQQTYQRHVEATNAGRLTGPEISGIGGLRWLPDPRHRLTLSVSASRKWARVGHEEFGGVGASLEHAWLLPRGAFLLSEFAYRHNRYDGPDYATSARTRRDDIYAIRSTLGVPLATLLMWSDMPRPWRDATFSVGVEYTRNVSNIVNFDYDNVRVLVGLIKRFAF